jgi:hypothetical protein
MLLHKQGGKLKACLNVFMFQAGVLIQNILLTIASRKKVQNGLGSDPFSTQCGSAVTYRGIDGNASV